MTIATMTLAASIGISTTPAFAENPKDSSAPNTWGKASSEFLAKDREMGEHASDPGDLDPSSPSREGIGNVARLTGGDHPSDIPGALCTDPNNELCN